MASHRPGDPLFSDSSLSLSPSAAVFYWGPAPSRSRGEETGEVHFLKSLPCWEIIILRSHWVGGVIGFVAWRIPGGRRFPSSESMFPAVRASPVRPAAARPGGHAAAAAASRLVPGPAPGSFPGPHQAHSRPRRCQWRRSPGPVTPRPLRAARGRLGAGLARGRCPPAREREGAPRGEDARPVT